MRWQPHFQTASPVLELTKTFTTTDNNSNGQVDLGDTINYTITAEKQRKCNPYRSYPNRYTCGSSKQTPLPYLQDLPIPVQQMVVHPKELSLWVRQKPM